MPIATAAGRGPELPEEPPQRTVGRNHRPYNTQNRIAVLLAHTVRYAFEPQARLARDVGVSRSTVSRLMRGRSRPSWDLMRRVTAALDAALDDRPPGAPLTTREVFSPDGTYPTPSGCALCGCPGCLPEAAFDRDGRRRPEYRAMRPGDWSMTPAPTVGPLSENIATNAAA
jgi:transcriptional regulator with XRE-family HTH domain